MKKISNIAHPLKNRTGLSQRTRINSALAFDTAPVDGKSLADRLVMIRNYSRYVNFYELSSNQREGDFQNISDWASFFKESLPFQLAILSKVNTEDVMQEFFALLEELKAHPSEQSLTLVLEYIFNNFVAPVHELYTAVIIENNSFHETLLSIIKSGFLEPLITFVCLYNTSANFLCVKKRNFNDLLQEPWQLKVDQIYAIDTCVIQVRRGKKEAFQKIGAALEGIFYKFFSGLEFIISSAPDYIQESLVPLEESLQERHQPHVALLFTFLELFKHFQGNINELGKKHLDFFYQQVLKMKPKAAEPDKAHIIFELAKHLKAYPLKKDLLLKDGKDKNKQDIQFGLDHELILDHAKIADLRTLSLHPVKENKDFLEGLYIAPVANSLDGVGKEFVEGQAKNWSTLGSKLSKFKPEGENEFQEHPPARLGFVLASPVLLLQEGRRTIIISLECSSDEDFFEKISALYDSMPAYKITENSADEFRALFPSNYRALDLAVSSFNSLLEKQVHEKIFKKDLDAFLLLKKEDGSELFTASKKTAIENLFLGLETIIGLVKLPLFKFSFSGEEKWLEPKVENITVFISSSPGMLNFEIEIILDNDFPSVTFFNEEILEEKIDIREVHPLVKIELNEAILVACENPETDDKNCCLRGPREQFPMLDVSPYQLLKNLKIKDAK
ncbi:MAG: hypothetical protein QNJ57_12020, partial [Flavobacteriaceae bacterium]|nr:hypothetical protein [Flavobacteriaceae bacterium]